MKFKLNPKRKIAGLNKGLILSLKIISVNEIAKKSENVKEIRVLTKTFELKFYIN